MWEHIFERLVRSIVVEGTLSIVLPSGRRFTAGSGQPEVAATIHDDATVRRIVTNPDLATGEGYMEGRLTLENDDLRGFLGLVLTNMRKGNRHWSQDVQIAVGRHLRRFSQFNPIDRARKNVAHHYDLSSDLYDLFLDEDRQYSCAYFRSDNDTLEQAQLQKKRHIATKLRLEPGMRVLDIGCGWGGMALTLAEEYDVQVTGITLSTEQHAMATARAEARDLSHLVTFRLQDYRTLSETFDRVVSVGMFEHVGQPHYDEYFDKVRNVLTPDGVALIHTIGRSNPPGITSPFIAKYIFPGGYIPSMSEMSAAIERQNLVSTDIEVWRLHYAKTLNHWERRFAAGWKRAEDLFDSRFCRMWKYYLVASEMSFVHGAQVVFQTQLSRRNDAVPITRDYMCREGGAA